MYSKSQRIVIISLAWAFLVLAVLTFFPAQGKAAENIFLYFFAACLLGFFAIVELSGPFTVRPQWKARASLAVMIGFLLFGLLVLQLLYETIHIPFL